MEDATSLCQNIQEQYQEEVTHDNVTLSMGIVYIPHDYKGEIQQAVISADKALYKAKKSGKNKLIAQNI